MHKVVVGKVVIVIAAAAVLPGIIDPAIVRSYIRVAARIVGIGGTVGVLWYIIIVRARGIFY